jgi:hypothetical protein
VSGWVEPVIDEAVREAVAGFRPGDDACTPAERIDRIVALDRGVAMLQAALSVEMATFARQRRRADIADGMPIDSAGRGATVEVAMARRVSKATVEHHLAFAEPMIADHPRLLEACLNGDVSQPAARNVVKACETLESDQRRAIDADLTALAMERTPGQLKKDAARRVAAADPAAATKRALIARAAKRIRPVVNGDGTGTLIATLPVEQAVAAWQALDHTARGRRADGDERSIRELMCDLFVERLTGQATATDLRLEIGVVVAASSLLGADDQPAKLIGHYGGDHGVLPAALARELATSESACWRRLVCDPLDGTLVSMDTRKRRFDGTLRKFLTYRDGTSRRPFSDTAINEFDHIVRHADGGPTNASNSQGLGKSDHPIRDLPGWKVEAIDGDAANGVRWTTPTGHSYTSRPPPILGVGNVPRRE